MDNLSFKPSIDLIIGPMYAGKSTELIRRLVIYHEMDMKVLYINSEKDNRSTYTFSTHNETISNLPFSSIKVNDLKLNIDNYDVIGIDEAQLFSSLLEIVLDWTENKNKIVIIYGLNADYKRSQFGEVNNLIPYCDTVTKLHPFCLLCKKNKNIIEKALFTKRITDDKDTIIMVVKINILLCGENFIFKNNLLYIIEIV